jgi:transcriptional regulator with XRE-family HTH domain
VSDVSFGQYLRQLRKAKGFTLEQLAGTTQSSFSYLSQLERGERGATTKQHLSNIENGRRLPSSDILRKLSQALNVSYIGMLIKAGHVTEDEVLTYREQHGVHKH